MDLFVLFVKMLKYQKPPDAPFGIFYGEIPAQSTKHYISDISCVVFVFHCF